MPPAADDDVVVQGDPEERSSTADREDRQARDDEPQRAHGVQEREREVARGCAAETNRATLEDVEAQVDDRRVEPVSPGEPIDEAEEKGPEPKNEEDFGERPPGAAREKHYQQADAKDRALQPEEDG